MSEAIRQAPVGHVPGLAAAVEQIEAGVLDTSSWSVAYDQDADIARIRRSDAGPAITYESPAHPDFLVRLDVQTGQLTGVDLMAVRSHFEEHSKRLHGLAENLAALSGRKREQVQIDPSELVSSFIGLSPVRLAASPNGQRRV
ncbi:MAG: DUF2283 domain-containing protein [Candidatus Dormibacteraeota bacterium]|nr:DUF2283 domain-containing protein [Candidatus Dormibacteraeota bacterium]